MFSSPQVGKAVYRGLIPSAAHPRPLFPLDAFSAGLGDKSIRTSLCPGGKERMRRMLEVVTSGRADLSGLVTHRFKLEEIEDAYELFANQRDGVLKVAITP